MEPNEQFYEIPADLESKLIQDLEGKPKKNPSLDPTKIKNKTIMKELSVQPDYKETFQVGSFENQSKCISSTNFVTQYNLNENNVTQANGQHNDLGFHFKSYVHNVPSKPVAIRPLVQLRPNIPSKPVTIRQSPYLQSKPKLHSVEDGICQELGIKFIPNIPITPYIDKQDIEGMRQPFNSTGDRSAVIDRFKESVTPKPPVIKQASNSNSKKYLPSGASNTKIGCSVEARIPLTSMPTDFVNEITPNAEQYKRPKLIIIETGITTRRITFNQVIPLPIKDKRGRLKKYSKSVMNPFKQQKNVSSAGISKEHPLLISSDESSSEFQEENVNNINGRDVPSCYHDVAPSGHFYTAVGQLQSDTDISNALILMRNLFGDEALPTPDLLNVCNMNCSMGSFSKSLMRLMNVDDEKQLVDILTDICKSRHYSAQAAVKQVANLTKEEAKVTRLPNGTVVAALDNLAPVARISVVFNGGSRSETLPGMAHVMRSAASLSSTEATAFSISRNLQQIGASLSCENSREHTTFSVNCLRSQVDEAVQQLSYVATSPVFKTWEVSDLAYKLRLDLANLATDPIAQLDDAVNQAAFRRELGNSLYAKDHRIGLYSTNDLKAMSDITYVSGNMAVVGYGVDSDSLLELVKKYFSGMKSGQPIQRTQATFYGGSLLVGGSVGKKVYSDHNVYYEVRIDRPGSVVYVALASEGSSLVSEDLLVQGVLQHAMGTGNHLKRGSNTVTSKLNKAATSASGGPCVATAFSEAYVDTGLFGFKVAAPADDISAVLKALVQQMNNYTSLTQEDITRAKNQYKAAIAYNAETTDNVTSELALNSLLGALNPSVESICAAIDKVSIEDVRRVAKSVVNGKPAMASVGDSTKVPYIDSMFN